MHYNGELILKYNFLNLKKKSHFTNLKSKLFMKISHLISNDSLHCHSPFEQNKRKKKDPHEAS